MTREEDRQWIINRLRERAQAERNAARESVPHDPLKLARQETAKAFDKLADEWEKEWLEPF